MDTYRCCITNNASRNERINVCIKESDFDQYILRGGGGYERFTEFGLNISLIGIIMIHTSC